MHDISPDVRVKLGAVLIATQWPLRQGVTRQRKGTRMSTAVVRLHGEVYPPRAVFLADVARLMARFACASADEATARHFGEHLKTGGKRLRARLVAAAGEALNAPLDGITAWAAAVELMHNATLIHDDIQDNDRMRRGQPTTWAKYGVGQAINVGDFGLMLPFMLAAEMNAAPATRASLTGLLARHGVCAAQGQTLALSMLANRRFDYATYERCIDGTTGAFFALPIEGTALLAGHSEAGARELGGCFRRLGILYQIQDDLVDLYGQKGRELPGGDLRAGKVSALVVEHLQACTDDAPWLIELLERPREFTTEADVAFAAARFRGAGTLAACLDRIDALADAIANDENLVGFPALQAVANSCLRLALAPLKGLRACS